MKWFLTLFFKYALIPVCKYFQNPIVLWFSSWNPVLVLNFQLAGGRFLRNNFRLEILASAYIQQIEMTGRVIYIPNKRNYYTENALIKIKWRFYGIPGKKRYVYIIYWGTPISSLVYLTKMLFLKYKNLKLHIDPRFFSLIQ